MFWEALSTFVSSVGALQQGTAAAKAAKFNASIARYNANVSQQAGQIEEDRVRRDSRRRIGRIRAAIGASGLDGGSADDLLADSMYQAELDALMTRFNYNNQAKGFAMQASMYNSAAGDAMTAGYIGAASALLRGGTNYYKNNNTYGAGETPFKLGGGSKNKVNADDIIWWD